MSSLSFLTALRLADSFLPVGTYTSSYGMEQYLNEGRIETVEELGNLVAAYLEGIVGPTDVVAVGNAHEATATGAFERLLTVDEHLHAATLPAEFRESSTKAGTQLLDLLVDPEGAVFGDVETDGGVVTDANSPDGPFVSDEMAETALSYAVATKDGETPGHYSIALGVLTACAGISRLEACLLKTYSFVTELLGAAQRLGAFGHTAIQTQLSRLFRVMTTVCEEYATAPLREMASFAPLAEIMGMSHEHADRRLFMS